MVTGLLVPDAVAGQDNMAGTFVDSLLARMTLEEKVGQMTQVTLDVLSASPQTDSTVHELDPDKLREAIVDRHVGSILNVYLEAFSLEHWRVVLNAIQEVATGETRLRIPVLYGVDAVHGHNYLKEGTLFPQNLAMAATWNPDLVRRANQITALEVRASGIPWNFSPVLDVGRQPLWSRFFETFGEDVHLATEMGLAAVGGLQGDDISHRRSVAACLKHFLGYSMPVSGKDRTPAWIPERMLREYFLPPFRAAIDAGARTLMVNSSEINGVPVHASEGILTDLLREELGFDGVIVTDWEDIIRLYTVHRVAASPKEAVRIAVEAGIDMSMVPYDFSFSEDLLELIKEGAVSESRIDESVRRILRLKQDLGLFENPVGGESLIGEVGTEASAAVSRRAADEAVTLVKNEGPVLPISDDARVLVTGFGAASLSAFHGGWTYTWQGDSENAYPDGLETLVDVLVDSLGIERVTYLPGTTEIEEISISAAVEEAFRADVVVIALAEGASTEKPGDIEDLELPSIQQQLVKAIEATGTPIVLVLASNRPRIIREIEPAAGAIILAYQSGPFGPHAVVDVLVGNVNPSGRLPFTYPRFSGSIVPYDHKSSERADIRFGWEAFNPQWEFGHGLSFTTFAYSDLTLAKDTLTMDGALEFDVTVANTGERAGMEVVQVYVRDLFASITPPVRRLRAFRKISLEPGESRVLSFSIPVSDLAFVGVDNALVVEPGSFEVETGGMSARFMAGQ